MSAGSRTEVGDGGVIGGYALNVCGMAELVLLCLRALLPSLGVIHDTDLNSPGGRVHLIGSEE